MSDILVFGFFIVLPLLIIILALIAAGIKVCQEYQKGVVFRLGRFSRVVGPGRFYINPFYENVSLIDLRTRTVAIEPQEAITADSVTVRVNAVLYYKVSDPKKAIIKVANFKNAINQAALTTLRSIIGQNQMDELLRERDRVNGTITSIISSSIAAHSSRSASSRPLRLSLAWNTQALASASRRASIAFP